VKRDLYKDAPFEAEQNESQLEQEVYSLHIQGHLLCIL